MRAPENSLCRLVAVPGLGGCAVAVRLSGRCLEVRYTGTGRELLAAGLTSIATLKANGVLPEARCCVVYRVEAFKALSLPGVLQALDASACGAPERKFRTGSKAARREMLA